jgi:hypothetical protein
MNHPRLRPSWLSRGRRDKGLVVSGLSSQILKSELTVDEHKHVFCSKFHYRIKHSGLTKCNSLVVLGNQMTQGED